MIAYSNNIGPTLFSLWERVDYRALLILAFTFQGPKRPVDSCISWGVGIRTNLDLNVI